MNAAPTIMIYVRHTADCKYAGDETAKRCDCRKHLRWTSKGKRYRRAAGTRSWAEAEEAKRQLADQLTGRAESPRASGTRDLAACVDVFLQDKRVQGIASGSLGKYTRELARLREFAERQGVFTVQCLTRELLTGYCATWESIYPSTQTRSIVRARLRAFLRYCYEAEWIGRIPPLPKITVDEPPTMPLSAAQYQALLTSTEVLDPAVGLRAHALFRLMRHSGLAVGDSLKLRRDRMTYEAARGFYRVQTNRQKTGTHVSVVIPEDVARELLALPTEWTIARNGATHRCHSDYFFWDGASDIVNTWTRKVIPKVFVAAKIERAGNMTSHRLRDTFACDLLENGVPLEEVSKLLGHESIKTTERHYAKWVKSRQDRLDDFVAATLTKQKRR